jgi:hypothetical protein
MATFQCGGCFDFVEQQKRVAVESKPAKQPTSYRQLRPNCSCSCPVCKRNGYLVVCGHCRGTELVPCSSCNGTGKRWFFGGCKSCQGSGQQHCERCEEREHKISVSCTTCKSLGADPLCTVCQGSACKTCLGKRRVSVEEVLSTLTPSEKYFLYASPSDGEIGMPPRKVVFPVFTYEQLMRKLFQLTNKATDVRLFRNERRNDSILTFRARSWGNNYYEVRRIGDTQYGIAQHSYGETWDTTGVLEP